MGFTPKHKVTSMIIKVRPIVGEIDVFSEMSLLIEFFYTLLKAHSEGRL